MNAHSLIAELASQVGQANLAFDAKGRCGLLLQGGAAVEFEAVSETAPLRVYAVVGSLSTDAEQSSAQLARLLAVNLPTPDFIGITAALDEEEALLCAEFSADVSFSEFSAALDSLSAQLSELRSSWDDAPAAREQTAQPWMLA